MNQRTSKIGVIQNFEPSSILNNNNSSILSHDEAINLGKDTKLHKRGTIEMKKLFS